MKERWEHFIDSLLEEWRSLNIVSALLVPGILTISKLRAQQLVILSHVTYRSGLFTPQWSACYTAASTSFNPYECRKQTTFANELWQSIIWNVEVMPAMPVLRLNWSILAFIVYIVWFMWRSHVKLCDNA
ncbi:hypothetical protein AN958_06585 [Leucoagaricus sp. SymC.cos]|nr:hypothetical protein AN958_06585 [Leucoagaricus sp. SymC.cos]